MKKVREKRRVLRTMTESDIKSLGSALWIRSKGKALSVFFVLCLLWMLPIAYYWDGNIAVVVAMTPLTLLWIWGMWRLDKEGKRLWNEVKDKEQPIDLG